MLGYAHLSRIVSISGDSPGDGAVLLCNVSPSKCLILPIDLLIFQHGIKQWLQKGNFAEYHGSAGFVIQAVKRANTGIAVSYTHLDVYKRQERRMKMKRALVLGGGGSKGAYELGVWRALDELGISFDIVTGTSIGAMIGAMYVQKQFERCLELWEQLSVDDIIANGVNLDMDIELLMSQKGKYKTLLKSYVKNRGADITPFVNKLQHYFDAERFFSSDIEYACMCVNVTKKQPQPVYRRDMSRDTAPVSYTHLDVYKRQRYSFELGFHFLDCEALTATGVLSIMAVSQCYRNPIV